MTQRRVFLHEYTEREVREMTPGSDMDWLVQQSISGAPQRLEYNAANAYMNRWRCGDWSWFDAEDYPSGILAGYYSRDWRATGPLLERLMCKSGAQLCRQMIGLTDEWIFIVGFIYHDRAEGTASASTPQLAIARAAVILALRKLAASREPGASEDGKE